jgi:ABC-type polysaccharide/polyol phosphate transport system ATPase subunit
VTELFIDLKNVGVTFSGSVDANGLRDWLARRFSDRKHLPAGYKVEALKEVGLHIGQGERVGLIGPNGAGKSTLLKVMAGIYPPTCGTAVTSGHVCPMFEFATGFEMLQSGRDNIRIRALLLGMEPDEIEAKLPEIEAFTELGEFLDYPVKTYSSGMFVRLAFAVSTSINPEILLIDEIMGAGDLRFAAKAKKRMFEFMEQGKILVFSSHSPELLRNFCTRTIWLEHGSVVMDGRTEEVLSGYLQSQQTSQTHQ